MGEPQPKQSRIARLIGYIQGKNEKEDDYIEEGIPGHSLKVIADKKLKERLDEWNYTLDLINEPINAETLHDYALELQDIIQTVHKMTGRIAGVYACAGDKDEENAKKLMHGWDHLAGIYKSRALRVLMWWGTDEKVKNKLTRNLSIAAINVFNFHLGMHNVFFKYADDVVMYCFKRIDVTPRHITAIQTISPNNSQVDMTKAFTED